MMPSASDVNVDYINDDGEGCFSVPSATRRDVTYSVDIAKAFAVVSVVHQEHCANTCQP